MGPRKRARSELEEDDDVAPEPPSMLQRIRNMWEFASFMQYLFLFGKAVKVEDFEVEEFEEELLGPEHSQRLSDIALTLLKSFSSFRPLNLDTFEEDMRRRYVRKDVTVNPFGDDEAPRKFAELDAFTKIRVLHQLSVWTFNNPDRIREKMPERESEQTIWRMEPLGWDEDERAYFVFDDDRLYRRTDAPLPPEPEPKTKAKGRNAKKTRSAKRRRISRPVIESSPEDDATDAPVEAEDKADAADEEENDGFGGMKWELVAVTLDEYTTFIDSIRRSRDPNVKVLHKSLVEHVLPIIEKRAEQLRQREQRKLRELENLQKLATAKRSSRLADKSQKRREQEEAEAAEQKRHDELAMARKEQDKQRKLEEARESRMMTREQRLKDREVKRILHEEELKRLEEEKAKAESNEGRISERHLKAEMERRQQELERMAQDEEWTFDCAKCGKHGQNFDDGSHSIACDKCGVWQHSACHGIKKSEAERDDFHFVCTSCTRKAKAAEQPKIPPLKIRFSASPQVEQRQLHLSPNSSPSDPPHAGRPPVGQFNGVFVSGKPSTNGHSTASDAPSSSGPQRPASSGVAHAREAPSAAATANFRYSLQRNDPNRAPLQAAFSPPQNWNHTHPQNYSNDMSRHQVSPGGHSTYSHSPPMANFNAYRPPSQGLSYQPSPSLPRPASQGAGHSPPPLLARPPSGAATPLANGHGSVAQAPSAFRPSASPPTKVANLQSTPIMSQGQMLHSSMRNASGPSTSPPGSSYSPAGQYAGPHPPSGHSPQALGISPFKHESPLPTASQVLFNSPPVVPPSTTLTPKYGNAQYVSPPVKKASPEQAQP